MKLSLEIIYQSKQSTKENRLGFWIDRASQLKEKLKHLYSNDKTGCLNNEAQAPIFKRSDYRMFHRSMYR
jgi:hypothetical protein